MDKFKIGIIAFTLLIVGGVVFVAISKEKQLTYDGLPRDRCVQHGGISMHIHPTLQIYRGEERITIPKDIGITSECMKAVHTHDETGQIHLEYPTQFGFTLGDFFANWGQPLSSTQVMDMIADDTHTITMTVDGQPSTEFENLVLHDKQQVSIHYDEVSSEE